MNWKKFIISGILAGIAISIITYIVSAVVTAILPYDIFSLGGIRAVTDPVMLLYFIYPWVFGFALSYAYQFFEKSLKGSWSSKGIRFGLLMWLVVGIPSAFMVYSSMNYPIGFTLDSFLGSLLCELGAGITIAWCHK